ncbi:MAG: cytochrome c biogenesis CcdA family protein [Ilumatobacter sp.]
MDTSLFLGGSVLAAFVAGTIALLAPCCLSVMLPAYFASSFQNRRVLAAMTVVFAAGIGTIVLPLALGASALRTLVTAEHTTIYLVGGVAMVGLGLYTLAGGRMRLPTPGFGRSGSTGVTGVYSLGLFSGIASSCCAPVLAGVLALSGVASSFAWAAGLGLAYVGGMVAPLFVISLLWDRFDWQSSRIFQPRQFTIAIGRYRRSLPGYALASGLLLTAMGAASIVIAFTGAGMSTTGWQARLSLTLQQAGRSVTDSLAWLPGWAAAAMLILAATLVLRRASRQLGLLPAEQVTPVDPPRNDPPRNDHAGKDHHDDHAITTSEDTPV